LSNSSSEHKVDGEAAASSDQQQDKQESDQVAALPQPELDEAVAAEDVSSPMKFSALSIQKLGSYYKQELIGNKQEIIN